MFNIITETQVDALADEHIDSNYTYINSFASSIQKLNFTYFSENFEQIKLLCEWTTSEIWKLDNLVEFSIKKIILLSGNDWNLSQFK